ncbi:MAG: hypothetical protein ACRCT8_17510 [Lacipirellulaceae bacterium]
MAGNDSSRRVTLTFGGEGFADGRVPLTLLADKLKALQSLLFHAAATVEHDPTPRRGLWVNRYRNEVELRFSEARAGSLVIEAELGEIEGGLIERSDLGDQAVDLAYGFVAAVNSGDDRSLTATVPNRQERLALLRSVEQLTPGTSEAYELTLANGRADHPGVPLSAETRGRTRRLIEREIAARTSDLEVVRLVGTLTKIHYDVAPQTLSVRVPKGREIACHYDDTLRDQVANLCAGSVVEVVGWATFDRNEQVKQLDVVTGVEAVSMEPIRIAKFEHAGRMYALREAVAFNIEFSEGVWAYSNDLLGIRGYAFKRDDALRELHEAFDFAYRDIGLAKEEALIGDAVEMKRELLRLVIPSKSA